MKAEFKLNLLLNQLDSFLAGKPATLKPQHKLLILLGAWAVPIAVFTLLLVMPKLDEFERLQNRINSLQTEIANLAKVANEIEQHRADLAQTEEQLQALSLLLPEEKEIPLLLTNISNLGTNSGLDFLLFRPQNEVRREFYAEIPVDIAVRGPYHNVGLFLDKISKLPRIVTVNNLNMGSPTRSGNQMYLNTTFTLLTYRFVEPEPEATKAQTGKTTRRR